MIDITSVIPSIIQGGIITAGVSFLLKLFTDRKLKEYEAAMAAANNQQLEAIKAMNSSQLERHKIGLQFTLDVTRRQIAAYEELWPHLQEAMRLVTIITVTHDGVTGHNVDQLKVITNTISDWNRKYSSLFLNTELYNAIQFLNFLQMKFMAVRELAFDDSHSDKRNEATQKLKDTEHSDVTFDMLLNKHVEVINLAGKLMTELTLE